MSHGTVLKAFREITDTWQGGFASEALRRLLQTAEEVSGADWSLLLVREPGNSLLLLQTGTADTEDFPLLSIAALEPKHRHRVLRHPFSEPPLPSGLREYYLGRRASRVEEWPLISHGNVVGLLLLGFSGYKPTNRSLAGLIELAALLLESSLGTQELYRGSVQLQLVRELREEMLGELDLPHLLDRLAAWAGRLLGASTVSVSLINENGGTRHHLAVWGERTEALKDKRYPVLAGLHGRIVQEKKALLFQNAWEDPEALSEVLDGLKASCMAGAPLVVHGRLLGILAAYHPKPQGFTPADLPLLELLAQEAAVAIANAQAFGRVQALAFTDPVTGLHNHRFFHDQLGKEIERARRFDRPLSLLFLDLDHFKTVNDRHGHRVGDQVLRETADLLRQNCRKSDLVTRYGGEEFAIILPESGPEEAFKLAERCRQALARHDFRTGHTRLELTVSIGLASFPAEAESKEALLLAADRAMYLAKGLGRNRVLTAGDLKRAFPERSPHQAWERSLVQAIHSLSRGRDNRDLLAWEHSQEVGRWAEALAKRLGLPPNEVELISLAGLLHDIGKFDLPRDLLAKAEPLTTAEWAEIRRHPEIGKAILEAASAFEAVIPLVYHHQERWDGSGYPEGLKGEEIPLGARLIAVADAFQAMVSDRPYRRALPVDRALEEIRRNAGTLFDPKVVAAFIELVESSAVPPSPGGPS